MNVEKLKPLRDQVVAELTIDQVSKGGIIIPATASDNEKPIRGVVAAVGPGAFEHGVFIEPRVKEGDKVLLRRFAGMEFDSNGRRMIVLEEKHILGVIS